MKCITLVGIVALLFSIVAYADSTLTVLGGKAVSNSIVDEKSPAWSIEQETPIKYGTWLFGYLNEGHKQSGGCVTNPETNTTSGCYGGDKRDGIYAQYKMLYQLTHAVETFVSVGPYFTATTITQDDGIHYRDSYSMAGLATAGVKVALNTNWSATARWNHVIFARDYKDADVFMFGVGYHPNW